MFAWRLRTRWHFATAIREDGRPAPAMTLSWDVASAGRPPSLLTYHEYGPVSDIRGHGSKALSRENIILVLKTQRTRSVCRVYPDKEKAHAIRVTVPVLISITAVS